MQCPLGEISGESAGQRCATRQLTPTSTWAASRPPVPEQAPCLYFTARPRGGSSSASLDVQGTGLSKVMKTGVPPGPPIWRRSLSSEQVKLSQSNFRSRGDGRGVPFKDRRERTAGPNYHKVWSYWRFIDPWYFVDPWCFIDSLVRHTHSHSVIPAQKLLYPLPCAFGSCSWQHTHFMYNGHFLLAIKA